ncbi:alpha-beta hydrolase superfamily lysophospholipase [Melghirimyces profundicolus]|uniref:Alpha-beta hydrolase superfamily lysophospholipase n=1 Tax=Melghirimyces profundicolus TaxID=1242148 RepID=A0A2T6C7H8_9BACL|nr:alpha/beta fold hydrolase [Melghirimyces profundicolus]PTX64255.1 alpha-beta hydrolase superfamily lysophospholipase [Melghirimyces profundicolus]
MVPVDFQEGRLVMNKGLSLRYRAWLPEQPRMGLIMVHGAGESLEQYHHLGVRLARSAIAGLMFDLRGFGHSGGRSGHVDRFEDYVEDLDQMVQYFREVTGLGRICLMGHSLGGLIATRYAQNRPRGVSALILSAPAFGLHLHLPAYAGKCIRFFSRVLPLLHIQPLPIINRLRRYPRLFSYFTRLFGQEFRDPAPRSYSFRWIDEILIHVRESFRYIPNLTLPTLCICGAKDPLVNWETVQSFFDRLPTEEKEWHLLADADHCFIHEGRSPSAIDTIIDWVNRR